MASSEEELTQDLVFEVLSSTRRRQVLSLLNQEGPMELTELAEHVAARENDTTVEELTKQQRKRVYVSLYQTHVPKLEDAGLVEHDSDSGVVKLRSRASEVDRYLGGDDQFPWQYVYLVVAGVGLALVLLASADVSVFGAVSDLAVAVLLGVAMAGTALVHLYTWTRT